MVRSTVGQSILGAVDDLSQFGNETDQRRLNYQTMQQNQVGLDADAANQTVQKVYAGAKQYENAQAEDGTVTYNIASIVENDKALAGQLLQEFPELTTGTDEKGRDVVLEPGRILKNEDGTYSVTVIRPDGKEAPVTQGRTAQGEDIVQKFDASQLEKLGNLAISNLQVRTGQDFGLVADMDRLYAAGVAGKLRENLANAPAAMKTQFLAVLADPDTDTAELERIADDMGVDLGPLKAQYQKRADEQKAEEEAPIQMAGGVRPEAEESTADTRVGRFLDGVFGTTGSNIRNRKISQASQIFAGKQPTAGGILPGGLEADPIYNALQDVRAGTSLTGTTTREQTETAIAAEAWYSDNAELLGERFVNDAANAKPAKPPLRSEPTLTQELQELGGIAFYEKYKGAELAIKDAGDIAATAEATAEASGVTIDPFSKEDLQRVISEGLASPTEAQYSNMRSYLEAKGVRTPQDLKNIPTRMQNYTALLIASRAPGDTDKKLSAYQSTLNYIERGATDYTQQQAESTQATMLNARASYIRAQTEAQKFYAEQSDKASESVAPVVDNFYSELINEDATTDTIANAWRSAYSRSTGGGAIATAINKQLPTMFGHLIQHLAEKSDNANWKQFWASFARDEMPTTVGEIENLLAVEKDGAGNIIAVGFKNPAGGYYEDTIDAGELAQLMGGQDIMKKFLAKASAKNAGL